MDINMPGLNGIDATRQIVDETEGIDILVMTMHDDDEAVFAAIRAGAGGYQLKGPRKRRRSARSGRRKRRGDLRAADCGAPRGLPCRAANARPEPRPPGATERGKSYLRLLLPSVNDAVPASALSLSPETVRATSRPSSAKL